MAPTTKMLQDPTSTLRMFLDLLVPPKWVVKASQDLLSNETNYRQNCTERVPFPFNRVLSATFLGDSKKLRLSKLFFSVGPKNHPTTEISYKLDLPEDWKNNPLTFEAITEMIFKWIRTCLENTENPIIGQPTHMYAGTFQELSRTRFEEINDATFVTEYRTLLIDPEKIHQILMGLKTCWEKQSSPYSGYLERTQLPSEIISQRQIKDFTLRIATDPDIKKNIDTFETALDACIRSLVEEAHIHAESKLFTMIFNNTFMIFILAFFAQLIRLVLEIKLPVLRNHPCFTSLCSCLGIMFIATIFNSPLPSSFGMALGVFFAEASLQVNRLYNSRLSIRLIIGAVMVAMIAMLDYIMPLLTMMFFIYSASAYYAGVMLANILWKIYLFFRPTL